MLSKVAERVYWAARYLERVESTARLVSIYDKLLFDLPKTVDISWYNLITINSLEADFSERYKVRDERNVVKFLIGDTTNPGSMVSSLQALRENVRTTRDVVPEEIWELTNELALYVQENLKLGINRSRRHEFLDDVIKGCHKIMGHLYGTMPRDEAWDFMRLGRFIERIDMTTRNLDAGMAAVMQSAEDSPVTNKHAIWGNVLRSLNAAQSYNHSLRTPVRGSTVVEYLITDTAFPKSIVHCLKALTRSASQLPRSEDLVSTLTSIERAIISELGKTEMGEPLRDFLNKLQINVGHIHTKISIIWFPAVV